MPYKDPEKQKQAVLESRKKCYSPITIRIKKDDEDMYEALQTASSTISVSVAEYMRKSTREKLIRDGYLPGKLD